MNKKPDKYNLPKLDKRQGGLVNLCFEFLSTHEEEKKFKLKRIIKISIDISKEDAELRKIVKEELCRIYGIKSKNEIQEKIDNRITIHIDAFETMVHRILQRLIEIGTDGYSGVYGE